MNIDDNNDPTDIPDPSSFNPILLGLLEYAIMNDIYNTEIQTEDGEHRYSIVCKSKKPNVKHLTKHLGNYIRIKHDDSLIKNNESCAICSDSFQAKQYKRSLPKCKHQFHKKCIDKWFSTNVEKMNCPICRENYNNVIII